jgi:HPt (histidine-containing phosphotransfer) domain-containing protein
MATSKNSIFQRNYKGTLGYELPDFEHQLFEISSLPLFDAEVYHQLFIDDDEWEQDLTELLELFIETLPEESALIKTAHEHHDWKAVEFMAHKIKGGCLTFGLNRLGIACQFLERYAKAGYNDKLEKLYEQMLGTINSTVPEVTKWVKTHH